MLEELFAGPFCGELTAGQDQIFPFARNNHKKLSDLNVNWVKYLVTFALILLSEMEISSAKTHPFTT